MDTGHVSPRAREGMSLITSSRGSMDTGHVSPRARDGHSSLLAVALWTLVMLVLELEMVTHHF